MANNTSMGTYNNNNNNNTLVSTAGNRAPRGWDRPRGYCKKKKKILKLKLSSPGHTIVTIIIIIIKSGVTKLLLKKKN